MDSKSLCLSLLYAESEEEVDKILSANKEMRDSKNWEPLDRRETNFNVTSNQASDGGKALTELMTNMVDAVLLKHAYQAKIDPKGSDAPKTMYEAVDKLVKNLRGGKLVNLDPKDDWLRTFAIKNLVIGITGAKNKKEGLPCYTFVDNGEGQNPKDFENTFLSLSKGNKRGVPFVQGKYNMGSSGVLRYCGEKWYKLIISRRFDGKGMWGWTLVRRRPDAGDNMPVAEYFIPNKEIPSFEMDKLFPFKTMTNKTYEQVLLGAGTVIKLYDYKVDSKFLSFRGSREALNENLVETILPFRLLDFRQLPTTKEKLEAAKKRGGDRAEGIDPRPFYGMEFLLRRSHKEEGLEDLEDDAAAASEDKIHVGEIKDSKLGEITISAIPLKHDIPSWLRQSNTRVFHAVNGQVQFKQSRGYLSQSCGLPALKDRVVIIVDASQLKFGAHNDIWKGDREHVSNTTLGEKYKNEITKVIRESEALKELQNKIAQQEFELAKDSESNALFQKLVNADPNLAGLLSNRDPQIRLPAAGGRNGAESGSGHFEGKFSPTFLRLEEKYVDGYIDIPINKARPISARTDAENGYLNRPDNRGHLLIPDSVRDKFGIRSHLYNGRLIIYLEPAKDKIEVGNELTFKMGLQDDSISSPIESEVLKIRIVEEAEIQDPKKRENAKPKSGDGKQGEGKGAEAPTHGLPLCVLLSRTGEEIPGYKVEQWPEGFDENEGGYIQDLGDNEVIYKINYDNVYHLKYRMQQRGKVAKDVVTEKYILGMRILMLGFERSFKKHSDAANQNNVNNIAEFADDFRKMAARGAAYVVLALAENLPKIVDTSTALNSADVE